jgi:hypothetical protein
MYFKFSDNDLLDGEIPYKGIFRVENDVFFKGYSENESLDVPSTFINSHYRKLDNFNNIYLDIDNIDYVQVLPFDTINKQYYDRLFDTLDNNNLKIYKSLVTTRSEIYDYDNVKYYTLSSINTDIILSNKSIHSDGFVGDNTWAFLDDMKTGAIFPTSPSTFKYLCSDGNRIISLSGGFNDENLAILQEFPVNFTVETQNITYNESEELLFILQNDQILIYDGLLYKNCDTLILLDSIKLKDVDTAIYKWTSQIQFSQAFARFNQKYTNGNPNNPNFIKFGKNYRTSIDDDFLFIMDRNSTKIINSIDLKNYDISDLITMNIREIDDKIAILHRKFGTEEGIFITFVDIFPNIEIITHSLENFVANGDNYNIDFIKFDSDLILLSNNTQHQLRCISKPTYQCGQITHESMKYLPKFKFGDTFRKFGNPLIKWASNNTIFNNFNYILSNNVTIDDISYHTVVCKGRFYVIKQRVEDFYNFRITKNLQKTFSAPECSKSSFGIYLNDTIYQILSDIIALQNQAHCKNVYDVDKKSLQKIDDLIIDTKNLYLGMNEKIHATNFQRIITNILKIQQEMVSISS